MTIIYLINHSTNKLFNQAYMAIPDTKSSGTYGRLL